MTAAAAEQRVSGLYGLVTHAGFYEGFQNLLGAERARRIYFRDWARVPEGAEVLDVGCGPGVAIPHLRHGAYVGVDLNPPHVAAARARGFPRAEFHVGDAREVAPRLGRSFDAVLCLGFLHHMSDAGVRLLMEALAERLRPGGAVLLLEPVRVPGQRWAARRLMDADSGLHIRDEQGYRALLERPGFRLESAIRHDLLRVPYDHFLGRLSRA